jgi:pyruvate/2-oxoglutarate dehydrogenase complex dihydrolipoamide dehydrogenase (E3) component
MEVIRREGILIRTNTRVESLSRSGSETTVVSRCRAEERRDAFDAVLVATGRAPNVEGLDLEAAGIAYDKNGVTVDDRLRTTNSRVYSAGDICSRFKFTHAADFLARIVIQNALFWGRAKASQLIIPWCTYTSPEVAHVGLLPSDAERQGIAIDTFTQPLSSVDRAILDNETEGFVKVHVRRGTDRIVGATIVAAHAGEMISEVTLAMRNGIGLKGLASTIHPYPTQADALRKIGDQYNKTRLTPWTKWLLKSLISLGR